MTRRRSLVQVQYGPFERERSEARGQKSEVSGRGSEISGKESVALTPDSSPGGRGGSVIVNSPSSSASTHPLTPALEEGGGIQEHGVSLSEATRTFALIGIQSFGGPAGQIAVMHRIL